MAADQVRADAAGALARSGVLQRPDHGEMLRQAEVVVAAEIQQGAAVDEAARAVLQDFAQRAAALPVWTTEAISGVVHDVLEARGIKMPKLGIPLRVAVTGRKQTPAVDAVLALIGRETVLRRLAEI